MNYNDTKTQGASGTSNGSGKKKTKKFRYKFHPDPNFDPLEYLLTREIKESVDGRESFKRELKKLRFGIYRAYGMEISFK